LALEPFAARFAWFDMPAIDAICLEYAEAFIGRVRAERDIALEIMLNRAALDYSLASLTFVDAYLNDVYESVRPPSGLRGLFARKKVERTAEMDHTILWGGAYVGEVLRRVQPAWSWLDYDDYLAREPRAPHLLGPRDLGTTALLVQADGAMTLPINKILRYVHEGDEHSTRHYVNAFS
jgi:hypothetical protein